MGTDITKAMSNIPAHIAARMASASPTALSTDLSGGLSQGGIPRISLKASRFRIIEGGTEIRLKETELDVIIVGANPGVSKTFYAKAWDPDDEPSAPDCWSMDGTYPDDSIADPVNDKCGTCPKNQWGSKLTPAGKQIKACADQKRLAVVSADDPGTVYLVQVTPAALQGLSAYNGQLKARGLEPNWITTTLSFDPEASYPKLMFSFGGFPTAEALEVVAAIDPDEIRRVVYGDMTIAAPVKAIEAKPKAKAPPVEDDEDEPAPVKRKPKLVVVEDDEDDEPAPAPVKAKAKPKAVEQVDDDEDEPAPAPVKRKPAPVAEDDEDEEPAPKPKPKAKAPPVEDDEDEDDAALTSFAKRKPRPEPEPEVKAKRKPPVENYEANDDEDEPAPKAKVADKKMSSLADSIKAKLSGVYAVEEEADDA